MIHPKQKDIGKRVTFRACTRSGNKIATRIIKVVNTRTIEVRYQGWSNFYVRNHEIIEIKEKK